MIEVEVKAKIENFDTMRKKLDELGAKKTKTDATTPLPTSNFPIFTGITRLGSVAKVNVCLIKAKMTCHLKILIEPEVEPVHPPVRAKIIKSVEEKAPHNI